MSYHSWMKKHASKHKAIVDRLSHLDDDELLDYFDFDSFRQVLTPRIGLSSNLEVLLRGSSLWPNNRFFYTYPCSDGDFALTLG